jgi:hypothetical protein
LQRNQFSLLDSEFPKEFALFVNFIGGEVLDSVISRVIRKLAAYSPQIRSLFGDRYFFHEQWLKFIDDPSHVDIADPASVRAASLIAGLNRVRPSLSPAACRRFRAAIVESLAPDRDMRQLEHEIRCHTHLGQKGFAVTFADLEGQGNFDLLLQTNSMEIEVECKTMAEDTGLQLKRQMSADLFEIFRKTVVRQQLVTESGIFSLSFNRPIADYRNLSRSVEKLLVRYPSDITGQSEGFSLAFEPRPQWTMLLELNQNDALRQNIAEDLNWAGSDYVAFQDRGQVVGLALRPHKQGQLRDRVVRVLKDAADQCTGKRPSLLWLHFLGKTEQEFLDIAQLSIENSSRGLNGITADVVQPSSSRDRSHIHTVRFSAGAQNLTLKPWFGPDRLLTRAASVDDKCYDLRNPYCRHPAELHL